MHAMSIYIAREQFLHHQTVERTQARSEDFHIRVVRALLHTHVFMKFKSSCTVYNQLDYCTFDIRSNFFGKVTHFLPSLHALQ